MITLGIHDLAFMAAQAGGFDSELCAFTGFATGGGDTFDCYDAEVIFDVAEVVSLPIAGTGFADEWIISEGKLYVWGDQYETYSSGSVTGSVSGSIMSDGYGFSGSWRIP